MKRSILRVGTAAASVLALGLMAGCGSSDDNGGGSGDGDNGGSKSSQSTLQKLKDKGTIVVGIADERPYSWVENGEPKGGTIAMHKKIFSNMGIDNVKVKEVDWNSLIPGLNAGRFDAVSAGMSILPDRCKQAAFSDPEIMYTTTLMVEKGNPKNLSDLKSVKKKDDVKLAVLNGGIEDGYAKKMDIDIAQTVKDSQSGMDAVSSGRADAFAMTAISLNWMAKKNPNAGVETTGPFVADIDGVKQYGAGSTVFRKDDKKLLNKYNKVLNNKILDSKKDYLDVVGKYGFTKENLPPKKITTKKLCAGDLKSLQ